MNWSSKHINLGSIKQSKKVFVLFLNQGENKEITSLTSSCGCSSPTYNKESKVLQVAFTPPKIPYHLRSKGFYKSTKFIYIEYADKTTERLSFSATVTK